MLEYCDVRVRKEFIRLRGKIQLQAFVNTVLSFQFPLQAGTSRLDQRLWAAQGRLCITDLVIIKIIVTITMVLLDYF
jgi:hypothetical protein